MVIFTAVFLGYSGHYLVDLFGDSLIYTFGKTGFEYAYDNFFKVNGRWVQGLTNDFRLYKIKGVSTFLGFGFFIYTAFLFFRTVVKKNTEALVTTASFYMAAVFALKGYYDFTFNLSVVLSYTLGLGLLFLLVSQLDKYYNYNRRRHLISIIVIIVLTAGLLEVHGISVLFLLGAIMLCNLVKYRRIQRIDILLFSISLVSNLLVFFSPGNSIRRQRSGTKLEIQLEDLSDLYLRNLKNCLDVDVLVFLLLSVVISWQYKTELTKNKPKIFGILLFISCLTLLPLLLIIVASPEKAFQLGRVENLSVIFMLMFVFMLGILIGSYLPKFKIPQKIYAALLLLPIYIFSQTMVNSKYSEGPKKMYSQYKFGDIYKYYAQEMALRDYLTHSTKGNDKNIPRLLGSDYRYTVIGLPNGYSFKDRAHPVYEEIFNDKGKLYLREDYPNPMVFAAVYFFENKMSENLEEVFRDTDLKVFKDSKYQVYIFQRKGGSPKDLFRIYLEGQEIDLNWTMEQNKYKAYYEGRPSIVAIPYKTQSEKELNVASDRLVIRFDLTLKLDDQLSVYYKTAGNSYNQLNSISKRYRKGDQDVTFILPTDETDVNNIRFDFASLAGQEVTFHKMELALKSERIVVERNDILKYFNSSEKWNVVLNKDALKFGVKEIDNFVDAKLVGNRKMDSLIRKIKIKSN